MATSAYDWLSQVKEFINENSDPQTRNWPFMESPFPLVILSICYLYFVCKAGPQYMRDKKPYDLKTVITVYNIFQISACIYIIHGMLYSGSSVPFTCETTRAKGYRVAELVWWTTMLKLTEYLETIFFVLRKKQNQVSGLHLYHHVSTLSFAWLTSKFAPVGTAAFPILLNSCIHVLMYSYYLIALHGGKELQKKMVQWKKSLTILQMVQFTIIIFHLLSGFRSHCQSNPGLLLFLMVFNVFVNYFLFYKFYRKTYNKNKIA